MLHYRRMPTGRGSASRRRLRRNAQSHETFRRGPVHILCSFVHKFRPNPESAPSSPSFQPLHAAKKMYHVIWYIFFAASCVVSIDYMVQLYHSSLSCCAFIFSISGILLIFCVVVLIIGSWLRMKWLICLYFGIASLIAPRSIRTCSAS